MNVKFSSLKPTGTEPTLLDVLTELFTSQVSQFKTAICISAFCNDAGLTRLVPAVKQFRLRRGKVSFYVGIDHQGTTVEGLQRILEIADDGYVFHNSLVGSTFHPKVYVFEKPGEKVSLVIGSSNLTLGGLYTNYEANVRFDFDLPDDAGLLDTARPLWEPIQSAPLTILLKLDDSLITTLRQRGDIIDEHQLQRQRRSYQIQTREIARAYSLPQNPFGKIVLPAPPPVPSDLLAGRKVARRAQALVPRTQSTAPPPSPPPLPPQVRSFVVLLNPIQNPNIPGEVRLPKRALDSSPAFWQYPQNYTLVHRRNDYWEWYAKWRINDHAGRQSPVELPVRMYLYPNKGEFRIFTKHLRNLGGSGGDILCLTPADSGESIDYVCDFVPRSSPLHSSLLAACNQIMPNSPRKWGFI